MIGLKFSAGPAVAIFKLNAEQKIHLVRLAVFNACLAVIVFKLEIDDGSRWYEFFDFKTCAGGRNVFQDRPLVACRAGFQFPLNFYQVSAKLSIFLSFCSHD